jgi:uncharacterized membrane protein
MKVHKTAVSLAIALVLASCATQPAPLDHTPGFLSGLFNGFTVVFSLIGSIFYNVRIYAYPNSGGWYDFGFVLGVVAFFSMAPLLRPTISSAATTDSVELTPAARSSEVVRQTFSFIVALCLTLAGAFLGLYLLQFAASKDWMLMSAWLVFTLGAIWLVMSRQLKH